ncbi:MAG: hypothetical protein EPN84_08505 [Legionella sp.]|nr:MAG: hypothetical protein EPN84_08505 [Legionella sp.]
MPQLIYVMGNGYNGKSSFVNYMLGHEFVVEDDIDLVGVKNESLPHAKIRTDKEQPPQIFESGPYAFCDCPGSTSKDIEVPEAALKLTQEYELTNSVKGFIVVISINELELRGTDFNKLCHDLQLMTNIDDLSQNIIFLFNNRGDPRQQRTRYFITINERINSLKTNSMPRIEENIAELNASLQQAQQEELSAKASSNSEAFFNKSAPTKIERIKGLLVEAHDLKANIEATIKLLSLINENNSVHWKNHATPECRELMLKKLESMKAVIPESCIHFSVPKDSSKLTCN